MREVVEHHQPQYAGYQTGEDQGEAGAVGEVEQAKHQFEGSDASYSPRRADLKPSGNHNARFTSTVMGPFRGKGGYSAPQQKRDLNGYMEVSKGPFFSQNRTNTATLMIDKRSASNVVKNKAQLPNVSKQRIQTKSHNDRHHPPPAYPNSVIAGNITRSSNSSKRRDIAKNTNNSFQVVNNNFIQTSYGNMGGFGANQLLNNSVGSTNTTRAKPAKYKIYNSGMNF